MKTSVWRRWLAAIGILLLVGAGCGGGHPFADREGRTTARSSVPSTSSETAPSENVPTSSTSTQAPLSVAPPTPPPTTGATPRATPPPSRPPASAPTTRPPVLAGTGPSIAGCPIFPADNAWNTDISNLPVDSHSGAWLATSGGPNLHIHPDFGDSGTSVPYGIPFTVTNASHPKVSIRFDYADESDPGPYPFGPDTPIEGGSGSGGDQHAIMLDSSTCTLYELYDANYSALGSTAGSGAIWSLRSDALRPNGWTSADAAGLPILPGLLRQDEVAAGYVGHAVRMTVQTTDKSFIWPARHQAGSVSDPNYPPMGARFRLKASVDISRFSRDTQAVLTAMKHFGLIVADNGSNWYFQGAAQPGWDNTMLDELKSIPVIDFEAVNTSSLMIDQNSGAAR